MYLVEYPRVKLAHLPTPLQPLDRLSKHLGGPRIWIKRDDATGLSTGGNKTRKLEFLIGQALHEDADVVLTQGATQSNHVRQTAAAAASLGLECHAFLEDRSESTDDEYNYNGNVLLDNLHGAKIFPQKKGADLQAIMEQHAEQLKKEGRKPYVIPVGGSNEIGALGYVNAAAELITQLNQANVLAEDIIVGSGSAGTQAGIIAGLSGMNAHIRTTGISVRAPKAELEENVYKITAKTAQLLKMANPIKQSDCIANSDYVGAGYGVPGEGTLEAIDLLARLEGILLDPVYTGKAMNGLIDLVRQGYFKKQSNIVFIHTGGNTGLFAYRKTFGFKDYRL